MDLSTSLRSLSKKVADLKNSISTEEATKTAFVLPFINALGYDIFNPTEVLPEFTADLGLKKGEKVDYAIYQNGNPILIIECKHWKEKLDVHNSQLFRYFHVTKTRFSLLTNGIEYRFYTDLDSQNIMDEKPFLEFDITKLKDSTINEISKFHKSNFDIETIVSNASSLKFTKEIKKHLESQFEQPSKDFIKLLADPVYNGRMTEKAIKEFEEIVKRAIGQLISEKVNDRLTSALNEETKKQEAQQTEPLQEQESKIDTTEEEMEGFQIILAILRRSIPKERIFHRDTQSYFGVLFDDNNRKPICRLHLNGGIKYISLFDENRTEIKEKIESIDDIYKYEMRLLETAKTYLD